MMLFVHRVVMMMVVTLAVSHERLVMLVLRICRMGVFPTAPAKVLEAGDLAAEVGALTEAARRTERVFQVRVHLHLLCESRRLDLDEGGRDGLHVAPRVVERHPAGSDRVLPLVRVDAGVHDAAEEVVEDLAQPLGGQHAVEGAHEHGLLRVQHSGLDLDEIGVLHAPGDDLHLLVAHAAGRQFEVPRVVRAAGVAHGVVELLSGRTRAQQVLDLRGVLEDHVEIAFGHDRDVLVVALPVGDVVLFARPLNANLAKVPERLHQDGLGHVPRNPAQKDLGREHRRLEVPLRQLTRPRARGVVDRRAFAVHLGLILQRRRGQFELVLEAAAPAAAIVVVVGGPHGRSGAGRLVLMLRVVDVAQIAVLNDRCLLLQDLQGLLRRDARIRRSELRRLRLVVHHPGRPGPVEPVELPGAAAAGGRGGLLQRVRIGRVRRGSAGDVVVAQRLKQIVELHVVHVLGRGHVLGGPGGVAAAETGPVAGVLVILGRGVALPGSTGSGGPGLGTGGVTRRSPRRRLKVRSLADEAEGGGLRRVVVRFVGQDLVQRRRRIRKLKFSALIKLH